MTAAISLTGVSKWYGQVLGLADIDLTLGPGIVGLLGPNGAGKSTMMKLVTGLLQPSRGQVKLFGESVFEHAEIRRRLGYCPEHEGVYEELSGLEFVTALAELSGLPRKLADARAKETLAQLGLTSAQDRRLAGYSKGMRQRAKLAQAMVHDPDVLILDEPLTGCDPLARTLVIDQIRAQAVRRTVLVSSHVLHEIEALTQDIVLLHQGRILAQGNVYKLRGLLDKYPHRVRVVCDRPRELAARLLPVSSLSHIVFDGDVVEFQTRAPDSLYDALRDAVIDDGFAISSMTSPDDNLGAVFAYLTGKEPAQ